MKKICCLVLALLLAIACPTLTCPTNANPLARRYSSGMALALALRDASGSKARFKVQELPVGRGRHSFLSVQFGQFNPQVRGAGTILLSRRTVAALGRIARGGRRWQDLQDGVVTVRHELEHANGPYRHRFASTLTAHQLAVEEVRAETNAQAYLRKVFPRHSRRRPAR